ncbi:unnamed protein product [Chrysoparadoxa australica]
MDSLGGNGLTLMLACVSPSAQHIEETTSTLNYAARARNIVNKPVVQLDPRESLIANLRSEVRLLRMENELLRQSLAGGEMSTTVGKLTGELPVVEGLPKSHPKTDAGQAVQQAQVEALPKQPEQVARLLAHYEEECSRLRKEAAAALQRQAKADASSKQYLAENELLTRKLERLEKAFVGMGSSDLDALGDLGSTEPSALPQACSRRRGSVVGPDGLSQRVILLPPASQAQEDGG